MGLLWFIGTYHECNNICGIKYIKNNLVISLDESKLELTQIKNFDVFALVLL